MLENIRNDFINILFNAVYQLEILEVNGINSKYDDKNYTIYESDSATFSELLEKYFDDIDTQKIIDTAKAKANEDIENGEV